MYLFLVHIAGGLNGSTSPIPTSGMVLVVIPDDGASGHVLLVGQVTSRDHTLCHTGLRRSRLLATITRFAKISGLFRLRHSGLWLFRNGLLVKLLPFCRCAPHVPNTVSSLVV